MKKIKPKIVGLVVALLSVLLAGVAAKEAIGDPNVSPSPGDGEGSGLW